STSMSGNLSVQTVKIQHGVLFLSNLNDRTGVRLHASQIQFYECNKTRQEDPAKVVKEALGKVLVHFYPLAGILRASPRSPSKLLLHCTSDGVSFVEADDDVSLQHLFNNNNMLILPFHCVEKLFDDAFVSTNIINSPLISIQGYYGNANILAYADTTSADLINNALSFATKLVHDAKTKVNEEYIRSVIDLIELRPVPPLPGVKRGIGLLVILNISRIGYNEIYFGWEKAVYGEDSLHTLPRTMSPFISVVDKNSGKVEIAAALCFPASAMQVIEAEILKPKMRSNTPVFSSSL
ncbi:hypothetical protein KI387_017633, partial [Taxus chinensis]